jgi:hypothetical protein
MASVANGTPSRAKFVAMYAQNPDDGARWRRVAAGNIGQLTQSKGGGRHLPACANGFLSLFPPFTRFARIAASLTALAWGGPLFAADGLEELLRETHWGEASNRVFQQFGINATRLRRPLDFGDSYADVIFTDQTLGGVPMVVFFQMDKVTHGLKRIQLERPRHGVNPPAFRAIMAALHAAYGRPDQTCVVPVLPASGYQAAAEERWVHNDTVISAIFRDTTLQAFEGCLFGPATGWCGLRGQLLVRIGPPDGGNDPCSLSLHHGSFAASASGAAH